MKEQTKKVQQCVCCRIVKGRRLKKPLINYPGIHSKAAQLYTEFLEMKCKFLHVSIHYCYGNIRSWFMKLRNKPQMVENNVENVMETWHLSLFHVIIWGTLQSPHRAQIRSFPMPCGSFSCLMCVMIYSLSLFIHSLLHCAFFDTPTFPPQPSIKT